MPLYQRTRSLINQFLNVEVRHVPRSGNDKLDVLIKLATSLILHNEREIQIKIRECHLLTSSFNFFNKTEDIKFFSILEVEEEVHER